MQYPRVIVVLLVSVVYSVTSRNVDLRPRFMDTPSNLSYYTGETATLRCGVRNRRSHTVSWRRLKDVSPLTLGTFTYVPDQRISSTYNRFRHEWNLHIDTVQMKDTGTYLCQVSTQDGMEKRFFLTISERKSKDSSVPKNGIFINGNNVVEVGQPLSLACNATGKTESPRDVEWFKGSERIISNSRTQIVITKFRSIKDRSLVSYLDVSRTRISDKGDYLCRSSDKESTTVKVHVLNASTFNVKRGTERSKSEAWQNSQISVKQQLAPQLTDFSDKKHKDKYSPDAHLNDINGSDTHDLPDGKHGYIHNDHTSHNHETKSIDQSSRTKQNNNVFSAARTTLSSTILSTFVILILLFV